MVLMRKLLRRSTFVASLLLSCALLAQQVMDNAAILKLQNAGLSEDLIVTTINGSAGQYDTSTDAIIALKKAGVSDRVLGAMISRNASRSAPAAPSSPPPTRGAPRTPSPAMTAGGLGSQGKTSFTVAEPPPAASFKDKMMRMAVCSGGAVGGFKIGERLADVQAKRLNLSPAQTKALEHKYEIGLALMLCNGGKALAGTVYANLSKKDQEARQKEIDAAVVDADPGVRNYAVPDHPDLKGTITTSPEVAEGDNQCRTVEDHLAEGDRGDSALVKYCRKPPSTEWKPVTGL